MHRSTVTRTRRIASRKPSAATAALLTLALVVITAVFGGWAFSFRSQPPRSAATLRRRTACRDTAQPATMPWPRDGGRVVAIGDPHSDPTSTLLSLRTAGLVAPSSWRWIGGRSVLVIVGDVADRGERSLELFRRLRTLRVEAARSGGRVVRLLGNHEAMLLKGNFRYVQRADLSRFASAGPGTALENFKLKWSRGGELAEEARCASLTLQLGGDTVFVHAGLLAEHLQRGDAAARPIESPLVELNQRGRDAVALLTGELDLTSSTQRRRSVVTKALKAVLGNTGPVWTRLLSRGDEATVACPLLADALAAVGGGARRMVVGHTVQQANGGAIATRCGGRLVLIDTGSSSYYGGSSSALELTPTGEAFAIYPTQGKAAYGGGGSGDRQAGGRRKRAVSVGDGNGGDGEGVVGGVSYGAPYARRIQIANASAAIELSAKEREWLARGSSKSAGERKRKRHTRTMT